MPAQRLRKRVRRAAAYLLAAGLTVMPCAVAAGEITVFAAASTKGALDEVAARWTEATGHTAEISFAGSSVLARQIQHGAPADVFLSASAGWMDALEERGDIDADTRIDLLSNSIVLIAHGSSAPTVEIGPGFDLVARLGDGRLAMAMVDAVPAGMYGKAALQSLGLWNEVAPHVAQADNVRAALALVAVGEAPLGIVYATDAAAEDGVTVVGTFPAETHPPIVYPAAVVGTSETPLAGEFVEFLRKEAAQAVFERHGFRVPG